MTAIAQGELFPETIEIRPTIAMDRGEAFVTQCSWCGLLVCADVPVKLGDCPACTSSTERPAGYAQSWWRQELPVGPFATIRDLAAYRQGQEDALSSLDTFTTAGAEPDDLDLPALVGEPEPLL